MWFPVGEVKDSSGFFNYRQHPGPIQKRLLRRVETEVRESGLALDRWNPVGGGHARRLCRPKEDVDRAILVLDVVLEAVL